MSMENIVAIKLALRIALARLVSEAMQGEATSKTVKKRARPKSSSIVLTYINTHTSCLCMSSLFPCSAGSVEVQQSYSAAAGSFERQNSLILSSASWQLHSAKRDGR